MKIDFSKQGVWQNAVVTVGFAPKFCAIWYGREIHCFHGDHFRAKFQFSCCRQFLSTLRKLQKRAKNKKNFEKRVKSRTQGGGAKGGEGSLLGERLSLPPGTLQVEGSTLIGVLGSLKYRLSLPS